MTRFEKISNKQFDKDFWGLRAGYEDILIPRRATKGSAGYDFYSPISFSLAPGKTIKIPTGIRVILPPDKFLLVVPRSGLGFKYRLQLDNTVGVIDSDYSSSDNEGHIWIQITNDAKSNTTANSTLIVYKGQAIAQGIILSYKLTDDDDANGIRNGGLGSTTENKKIKDYALQEYPLNKLSSDAKASQHGYYNAQEQAEKE